MRDTLQEDKREFSESLAELQAYCNFISTNKIIEIPKEGTKTEVDITSIKRKLLNKERKNLSQEETRKFILEGLAEADANLEKYGRPFEAVRLNVWRKYGIPWRELKELAKTIADHEQDWIELALEFAQIISNRGGSDEIWQNLCNNRDNEKFYRVVTWKKEYGKLVGDALSSDSVEPPSLIHDYNICDGNYVCDAVSVGIRYK